MKKSTRKDIFSFVVTIGIIFVIACILAAIMAVIATLLAG
jgi:hypothetical protein